MSSLCDTCKLRNLHLVSCTGAKLGCESCMDYIKQEDEPDDQWICAKCVHQNLKTHDCDLHLVMRVKFAGHTTYKQHCDAFEEHWTLPEEPLRFRVVNDDPVNSPGHYVGKIECIDYLRDKLTPAEFTGFCMGNVLKYCSRWRKKDGVQDLKKAQVYLGWAIGNEEKRE